MVIKFIEELSRSSECCKRMCWSLSKYNITEIQLNNKKTMKGK